MKHEGSIVQAGFTTIELLLVLTLILILWASSATFYSRFLNQSSVSAVSDQIVGEFRKSQIYAMEGKQNTNWGVSYGSSTITLFATASSAFNETFSVSPAISVTGLSSVTFSKANGSPSATPTIVITSGGNSKTISVNSQGTVIR